MTGSAEVEPPVTPVPAWLPEHERKRRAILDGAAEVFYRDGFLGGTTKDIAAHVGLSQPAIYHYVGSKASLLDEIARQVDRDLTSALDAAVATDTDPVEQLRGLIRNLTEAIILNRKTFVVYWKELDSLSDEVREEVSADEREFVKRVEDLVAGVQDAGALPAGEPPRIVTEALLGMISWVARWYRPEKDPVADEVATTFLRLLDLRD